MSELTWRELSQGVVELRSHGTQTAHLGSGGVGLLLDALRAPRTSPRMGSIYFLCTAQCLSLLPIEIMVMAPVSAHW